MKATTAFNMNTTSTDHWETCKRSKNKISKRQMCRTERLTRPLVLFQKLKKKKPEAKKKKN